MFGCCFCCTLWCFEVLHHMEKMSTYSFNVLFRLILSWRYSQNLWPNRYAYLILNSGYSNKDFPQLMFYFILSAGVAYAKTLGWFLKMCISDAATFFSCIIAGTASCSLLCDMAWIVIISGVHPHSLSFKLVMLGWIITFLVFSL